MWTMNDHDFITIDTWMDTYLIVARHKQKSSLRCDCTISYSKLQKKDR